MEWAMSVQFINSTIYFVWVTFINRMSILKKCYKILSIGFNNDSFLISYS